MNFYKLNLIEDGEDIYINPNSIMAYTYENDKEDSYVTIFLNGGDYVTVSNIDFKNMMILEGVDEY